MRLTDRSIKQGPHYFWVRTKKVCSEYALDLSNVMWLHFAEHNHPASVLQYAET